MKQMDECKIVIGLMKFTIQFVCFTFVAYQTYQCFEKFLSQPKNTEISIKHADEYPYPDVTLCPYQAEDTYKINLAECNLTTYQYFGQSIWYAEKNLNSTCNDPESLYHHFTKAGLIS